MTGSLLATAPSSISSGVTTNVSASARSLIVGEKPVVARAQGIPAHGTASWPAPPDLKEAWL